MTGAVYIVHAVDTEGPLCEGLDATFQRLEENFDVRLPATRKNLVRLQKREIDLGSKTDAVADFVSPDQISTYNETWDQIDTMHETVMSSAWRGRFTDSAGEPYVISWHCMDHAGFIDNPRRRSIGFHSVYDHYRMLLDGYDLPRDRIYWHYHPVGFSRQANRFGRNQTFTNTHNEILARRIIDRHWFPSANRPGGHMEHYDSNVWLEAWIPFDLANQNMNDNKGMEKLISAGRITGSFGDWRNAPDDWKIYHPDLYDFRTEGSLKRWICRCLNINARHSNINAKELEKAFLSADHGNNVLVAVTNHDFRNMTDEIEYFYGLVKTVSRQCPEVPFRWTNAVEAFRAAIPLKMKPPVSFKTHLDDKKLTVTSNHPVWGIQPFLALRTHEGSYYHDNFIIDSSTQWTYPFDATTISKKSLTHIGFAANDSVGNVSGCVCELDTEPRWTSFQLHHNDWLTPRA